MQSGAKILSKEIHFFCNQTKQNYFLHHWLIGAVEYMIQRLKSSLGLMRIDKNYTSFQLASDFVENIRTLQIYFPQKNTNSTMRGKHGKKI